MDMLIKADKRMSMRNEGCLTIGHANNYDIKILIGRVFDKLCDE